jgi:hypothetical protein
MAQAPPFDSDLPQLDLGTYQEDGEIIESGCE